MPYIISVTAPRATARTANGRDLERHERSGSGRDTIWSVAVATIEEARDYCQPIVRAIANSMERSRFVSAIRCLPSSGGTIGPMPDSYVIDVQMVSPLKLAALAGLSGAQIMACKSNDGWNFAPIIDAFNNR